MTLDELTVDELTVDKLTVDELTWCTKLFDDITLIVPDLSMSCNRQFLPMVMEPLTIMDGL